MKKKNIIEEYEQLTFEFNEEAPSAESVEEVVAEEKIAKKDEEVELKTSETIGIGSKITVNPDVKKFCDGLGIPDYARTAYVKRINASNDTVVIETTPGGRELGLLFLSNITLAH